MIFPNEFIIENPKFSEKSISSESIMIIQCGLEMRAGRADL